jgi:hypothetical protein
MKGLHKPEWPQEKGIVSALISPWLNSERARVACGLQWDKKTAD